MIEIKLSQNIINKCRSRAKDIGKLKNSITRGKGNLAGIIGEYIVHKHLKNSKWENTYDYDLIHKNKKIDVKSKRCNSPPLDFYECSIAETSLHQECDEYVFVRILNDFTKAWILGRMTQKKYFKTARKMIEGQVDPSNNFTVKTNCYNIPIKELNDLPVAQKPISFKGLG
jgi:hypothetical protein|tara:strand:- start:1 stop:513 length:513 start_codon:yes stop_codon:yes gene_type:complete